jgi:hypothetical protein
MRFERMVEPPEDLDIGGAPFGVATEARKFLVHAYSILARQLETRAT